MTTFERFEFGEGAKGGSSKTLQKKREISSNLANLSSPQLENSLEIYWRFLKEGT